MQDFYNKHYIRVDGDGNIVKGFSDAFELPQKNDICINQKGGYQFRLFPHGEENPMLRNDDGVPLYQWDGKAVKERTGGEGA